MRLRRNVTDLLGATYSSFHRIWEGSARRVALSTLNNLCNLLDVPVSMLLVHMPDNAIKPVSETTEDGGRGSRGRKGRV